MFHREVSAGPRMNIRAFRVFGARAAGKSIPGQGVSGETVIFPILSYYGRINQNNHRL